MKTSDKPQTIIYPIPKEKIAHIWTDVDAVIEYLQQKCEAEPDVFKFCGTQDIDEDHVYDFSCLLSRLDDLYVKLDALDDPDDEDDEDCTYENDKVNGREVYGLVIPTPRTGTAHIVTGDPETIEYLNQLCEEDKSVPPLYRCDSVSIDYGTEIYDFVCPLDKVELGNA